MPPWLPNATGALNRQNPAKVTVGLNLHQSPSEERYRRSSLTSRGSKLADMRFDAMDGREFAVTQVPQKRSFNPSWISRDGAE